jgi:hypothetical protein
MASHISYYFTLFKKFQILNHVPSQTVHGAAMPTGGFDLKNPNAPFVASATGTPLTVGNFTPAQNPLWAVLNSRALGNSGFTPVNIVGGAQNGTSWPTMPPGTPPAWTEFQVTPASHKLVDVFGTWISTDQQLKDIPSGALGTMPANFAGPDPGVKPFVCSKPGDQGARPTALPNFWATSLIFLVDPATGNTITPPSLVPGAEHYVVAVVGNRGSTNGGRFLGQTNALQAAAVVQIFGTSVSPGVRLPALSNLDLNDTNSTYEQYFLRSGQYDVVGFRLNVQTVFDGLVAAVHQAAVVDGTLNIGSSTPEQWIKTPPSHLCVKVVTRVQGDQFPAIDTSPEQDARIAQKNLVPFDVTISDTGNPHIDWTTFVAGQPSALMIKNAGKNKFTLLTKLPQDLFQVLIAIPEKVHAQFIAEAKAEMKGFRQVNAKEILAIDNGNKRLPFARDAIILQATGAEASFELGPMPDHHAAGMALGFRYVPGKLKHGMNADVTVMQEAAVPLREQGSDRFTVQQRTVGGFTLQVRAVDPHVDTKGRRIEFGLN